MALMMFRLQVMQALLQDMQRVDSVNQRQMGAAQTALQQRLARLGCKCNVKSHIYVADGPYLRCVRT